MNSRQLQYAILLAETGNFSHVAKKLKITQPALSKQILALESELGTQLFDRTGSPITLTAAGQYFIREAKQILYKETQLLQSMEQFKSESKGRLTIGITPFRSAYLISTAIKQLREKFPDVEVRLVEKGNNLLKKDVIDGKFDFAIINLPVDESQTEIIPMEPDRLVLVMPKHFTDTYPYLNNVDRIDFKECANIPFSVVGEGQEMRILFDKLCASAGIQPTIATEVVSLTTSWEMVNSGIAAALLPLQFVNTISSQDNIRIIELTNRITLRQPAIVYKRGHYLSDYAKYAISLLSQKHSDQ